MGARHSRFGAVFTSQQPTLATDVFIDRFLGLSLIWEGTSVVWTCLESAAAANASVYRGELEFTVEAAGCNCVGALGSSVPAGGLTSGLWIVAIALVIFYGTRFHGSRPVITQ
jgi:hypothetical protein